MPLHPASIAASKTVVVPTWFSASIRSASRRRYEKVAAAWMAWLQPRPASRTAAGWVSCPGDHLDAGVVRLQGQAVPGSREASRVPARTHEPDDSARGVVAGHGCRGIRMRPSAGRGLWNPFFACLRTRHWPSRMVLGSPFTPPAGADSGGAKNVVTAASPTGGQGTRPMPGVGMPRRREPSHGSPTAVARPAGHGRRR